MKDGFDRRTVLVAMGFVGVAAAVAVETTGARVAAPVVPRLPQDLTAGGYRVESVGPVEHGSFLVTLAADDGDRFDVRVCARDEAGPRGPARTDVADLFVVNDGGGSAPTHERHGLATMALAERLREHDGVLAGLGLVTLRARLDNQADLVVV